MSFIRQQRCILYYGKSLWLLSLCAQKCFLLKNLRGAGDVDTSWCAWNAFKTHQSLRGRWSVTYSFVRFSWQTGWKVRATIKETWARKVSIFLLHASSVASPPPQQGQCTCALIKSSALIPTSACTAPFHTVSWIIDSYSCFSPLDPALTTQVTPCCTVVLILLLQFFLLLFSFQLLQMTGEMNKRQKPHRYLSLLLSGFLILYICASVLLRFQGFFPPALTDYNLPADPLLTGGLLILTIDRYNWLCCLYHCSWTDWCRHSQTRPVTFSLCPRRPVLFSSVHAITPADISAVYMIGLPSSHR